MWQDPRAKATKLFVVFFIYKTSIYTTGWTRNPFLGGQAITFVVNKKYIFLIDNEYQYLFNKEYTFLSHQENSNKVKLGI